MITFHVVNNALCAAQDANKLMWLMQLQSLFSMQLPRMPKEYITRLVFDFKHKNMVLVKQGLKDMQGLLYSHC